MSLRLCLLERCTPTWVKRRLLDDLARITAQALGGSPPQWRSHAFPGRLQQYAAFSAAAARRLLDGDDQTAIADARARLRESASGLGASLRRALGVRSESDVMAALTLLYRHIGIDFRSAGAGRVMVTRCAFAGIYDERVCTLMSALDEGVAGGLSAHWQLCFTERITAGADCCTAAFLPEGVSAP